MAPDGGPFRRPFLISTDGFFGDPDYLTLSNNLIGRQVAERAVSATLGIVEPSGFKDMLNLSVRDELMHVQTLVAQSSVKRFHKSIFHRFAGSNEVELHTSPIGPIFQRS